MLPARLVVGFLFRLILVSGLVMASWPLLRGTYAAMFHAGGGLLFGSFGATALVRFEPLYDDDASALDDTKVFVGKRGSRKEVWTTLSTWQLAYFSTAVLCGLIIATPISRVRRVHSLLWGLLLLHGLVGLRVALIVVYNLSMLDPNPPLEGDGLWSRTLRAGIGWASTGQMVSYLLPIGIWILVCFRREDLGPLIRGERSHGT